MSYRTLEGRDSGLSWFKVTLELPRFRGRLLIRTSGNRSAQSPASPIPDNTMSPAESPRSSCNPPAACTSHAYHQCDRPTDRRHCRSRSAPNPNLHRPPRPRRPLDRQRHRKRTPRRARRGMRSWRPIFSDTAGVELPGSGIKSNCVTILALSL